MAHPKRKHSKSRTGKRRSQYRVEQSFTLMTCENCGAAKMRHRACPACGHYRGRAIIERSDYN